MLKFPRIIYFIGGPVPTKEEAANAVRYGANTVFRNAALVDAESNVEICDGVAGIVPHKYKSLPDGAVVIQNFIAANSEVDDASGVPPIPLAPATPPAVPVVETNNGWGTQVKT